MSFIYCAQHDPSRDRWLENVNKDKLKKLNDNGYGIFKTVNMFDGERKKSKLKKIISWAIDIDDRNKYYQAKRILEVDIEPSKIIESKRGYHIYWDVKGDTNLENYEFMISKMLIPIFGADEGAKDVTRVLRLEGYYHCKDEKNKFLIKKVYQSQAKYSETLFFNLLYLAMKKLNLKIFNQQKKVLNGKSKNNITAEEIAFALQGKKVSSDSYLCFCPAHKETRPSFRVTQRGDKVLLKCFGKCDQDRVIKKLIELNLWR